MVRSVLALVFALQGCVTLEKIDDLGRNEEAYKNAAGGKELALTGELTGKDGFAVDVPVVVAADRQTAALEIDGGKQVLRWTGEKDNCPCRTYESDAYAVEVRFPGGGEDGEATVTRIVDPTETLAVDGVLEDEDGLEIRVTLIVADNKESVTFHNEGEPETLTWDKQEAKDCGCRSFGNERFQATVWFPQGEKDGDAKVLRRKS